MCVAKLVKVPTEVPTFCEDNKFVGEGSNDTHQGGQLINISESCAIRDDKVKPMFVPKGKFLFQIYLFIHTG